MIKVICGRKGVGKSRMLVENANNMASESAGDVVFIDGKGRSSYKLKHKIRFINMSEFPVSINKACSFLGFLCGVISEDYDIKGVFVDDFAEHIEDDVGTLNEFFEAIGKLAAKFEIDFYFSIEGDPDTMPDFIKAYY